MTCSQMGKITPLGDPPWTCSPGLLSDAGWAAQMEIPVFETPTFDLIDQVGDLSTLCHLTAPLFAVVTLLYQTIWQRRLKACYVLKKIVWWGGSLLRPRGRVSLLTPKSKFSPWSQRVMWVCRMSALTQCAIPLLLAAAVHHLISAQWLHC